MEAAAVAAVAAAGPFLSRARPVPQAVRLQAAAPRPAPGVSPVPVSRRGQALAGGTIASVLVALAFSGPAPARAPVPQHGRGVATQRVARSAGRVSHYWTASRMAHATPL